MRKAMLVVFLIAALAGSAAAQCCGDCNGNGHVTIDELVTAVNNALADCGAATPTPLDTHTPTPVPTVTPTPLPHCPFTFSDSGNLCTFNGPFNRGCGANLDSLLNSNGASLVISVFTGLDTTPVVTFTARVDSPTSASLLTWSSDNNQTVFITAGVVQLTDNGRTLVIFPNDPPFMILSCNFTQYNGTFTGTARTRAAEQESGAARDRLQAWLARPLPDLADQ